MLEQINSPQDLKKLNEKEKKQLAEEIRKYILDVVSENGGHLASNLGVVELTIALHSVFNVPEDKIVWDVGHQSYVHKIITGRREELKNIRKLNGIAGFPKSNESDADCFNTGHSSTSISAVLGMARARDLQGKKNSCIAVIGDGALTGGMALEALNDAGCSNCNLTVILNDNEMSIAKNIGGINQFLSTLRTKKLYTRTNRLIKNKLNKLPVVGNKLVRIIQRFKRACKQLVIRGMYFEDIGFTYLGPVDGHNIEKLESILKLSKEIEGPVLIHVLTKKGKGYKIAEKNPDRFHATSPFNIETGELKKEKKADYSKIFGEKLVKLARENEKIVAVTASMKDGTGLREFQKEFPKRFFDVGIAEQHAITMSAGMAKEGMIPVIPIYSSFYQRAYDQVIHDVALLAEEILPLVFVENGHGPEILDRLKDLFVVHRNRVCLVDDQVIGLPLFPERVIWLIEQREDVLFVQHLIQNFFCDVDLIDHHVIVVGVLRGNDNAQLVDEGDLRRSHGLHRIAVQRAGLVRQEDICQTAVHAVVGICEGCIFNLVDQAGDQIPVDLEILRQCRRDLDDLAHGQPQLRGQLEVRRHREETGEAGLRQHPQNEDDCGVEGLEVLSGDLENSGLIEAPVVLTPPRTEYGHDQEPGIIFKAVIHGAVEIRVHHQL